MLKIPVRKKVTQISRRICSSLNVEQENYSAVSKDAKYSFTLP
jgi:hypothetical protein